MSVGKKPTGWRSSNNGGQYNTARWRLLREDILRRDKYLCKCMECTNAKRLRPANEVDHKLAIANGGDFWDPDNLQAINTDCHKKKTARDRMGDRGLLGACSIDGLPVDPNHPWNRK